MSDPSANPELMASDYATSHPLRPLVLTGTITLLAYSGGVVAVSVVTAEHAPTWIHSAWTGSAVLFLAIWLALVIVMSQRQPDAEEAVRVWGWASRFIACTSQLLVAAAIWGMMGWCTELEQNAMAAMFMLCSPAQLIAAPENVLANRLGIVASHGSLVVWFVIAGGTSGYALAGFNLGIGAMLFVLADYLPGAVAETVRARLAAQSAQAELQAALDKVAGERDAKTRFIAAASHDLGQPLHAANLFFEQMEQAGSAQQRSAAADGVKRAFASAEQLLSHMLNHLRLEADAVDPQMGVVDLGDAVRRTVTLYRAVADEAGIALRGVAGRSTAFCDRALLDRALGNLVDNAVRHSRGSRVLIGTRKSADGQQRLWVIDDGIGIDPTERDLIFEDYVRGELTTQRSRTGFGLGLSSVRRIAALLGGEVGVEPGWRAGAAFYLELPETPLVRNGLRMHKSPRERVGAET